MHQSPFNCCLLVTFNGQERQDATKMSDMYGHNRFPITIDNAKAAPSSMANSAVEIAYR